MGIPITDEIEVRRRLAKKELEIRRDLRLHEEVTRMSDEELRAILEKPKQEDLRPLRQGERLI